MCVCVDRCKQSESLVRDRSLSTTLKQAHRRVTQTHLPTSNGPSAASFQSLQPPSMRDGADEYEHETIFTGCHRDGNEAAVVSLNIATPFVASDDGQESEYTPHTSGTNRNGEQLQVQDASSRRKTVACEPSVPRSRVDKQRRRTEHHRRRVKFEDDDVDHHSTQYRKQSPKSPKRAKRRQSAELHVSPVEGHTRPADEPGINDAVTGMPMVGVEDSSGNRTADNEIDRCDERCAHFD